MKLQNRLAAVLTGAVLLVTGIGMQSAVAANELIEKTGMRKILTYTAAEWSTEGVRCDLPADLDWFSLMLCSSGRQSLSRIELNVESYDRFDRMREMFTFQIMSSDQAFQTKLDVSASTAYLLIKPQVPEYMPEDSDYACSVYACCKDDVPDPSLSEVTGTTTGTAAVGRYEPDYDPWFTDEHGNMLNRGTNAYYGADMDIRAYPNRVFAIGQPFSTEGLKVVLTENRRFNQREHDVSDCLQIRTDYNPNEPGEYLVYVRTDYRDGEVRCDDYLIYTVVVEGDVTYGSTEQNTSASETETTTTSELLSDSTEPFETVETIETVWTVADTTFCDDTTETEPETETETAGGSLRRPGDVDCNGQVAIADAVLLARYLAEDAVAVTAQGLVNAELDGDSTALSAADLSVLLQLLAGSVSI